jgi:hypothetical protein
MLETKRWIDKEQQQQRSHKQDQVKIESCWFSDLIKLDVLVV